MSQTFAVPIFGGLGYSSALFFQTFSLLTKKNKIVGKEGRREGGKEGSREVGEKKIARLNACSQLQYVKFQATHKQNFFSSNWIRHRIEEVEKCIYFAQILINATKR